MSDTKKLRELANNCLKDRDNITPFHLFQEAANPQAIIELIDRLEEAEAVIQHYRETGYHSFDSSQAEEYLQKFKVTHE